MAKGIRKGRIRKVPLSQVKDHLSEYLRAAEKDQVVIMRHGKPAGVLVGFQDEDDWFDYRLENDPAFLRRVAEARQHIKEGKGTRLEELKD